MINYNKAFALPNEVWNPVKGYEGLYKVSSMGRVKSLERISPQGHLLKERILRLFKNPSGYLYVNLNKDGKHKQARVHRLVAEAFLGNPDNLPQINHRDEVKTSNHYSNLEWCDTKYNNTYGTRIIRVAEKQRNGKLSKKVCQYNLDGELIKEWSSIKEVQRQLGYNTGCISACCLGKYNRKTAYGYKWKYK